MTTCNLPVGVNLQTVGSEIATWNAFRQGIAQQHHGRFLYQPTDTIPNIQLKMTIEGRSIDLLGARACLPGLIGRSAPEAKESIEFALETFDGIVKKSGGSAITRDGFNAFLTVAGFNLSDPLDQLKAQNYALQVGRLLEILLFVSVAVEKPEDTSVFGQVMPSAAFEVFDPNKCPDGKICQTEAEAATGKAKIKTAEADAKAANDSKAAAVSEAHDKGVEEGKKQGGGDKTSDRRSFWGQILGLGKAVATPGGGAVTATVVVAGGFTAWIINRRMARQVEQETAKNTLLRPEPGAVTVMNNADGSRSFLAWESVDAQGQRWGIRVQPYSEEEASDKLDTSRRRIQEITRVANPREKEQAELRVARGYVAQFEAFFPQPNANQGATAAAAAPT